MVQTQEKTACSFIPIVTSKSTARVYTWRNRVRSNGRNERLELLDAKVSRAVLRGRDGGNAILLPDTLVEVANAAARTKNTYLSAQYHRLAARRGRKRALIAVAHTILVMIYRMLSLHQSYEELGSNYFDERDRHNTQKRLVRRLEKLGFQVDLQPISPAA